MHWLLGIGHIGIHLAMRMQRRSYYKSAQASVMALLPKHTKFINRLRRSHLVFRRLPIEASSRLSLALIPVMDQRSAVRDAGVGVTRARRWAYQFPQVVAPCSPPGKTSDSCKYLLTFTVRIQNKPSKTDKPKFPYLSRLYMRGKVGEGLPSDRMEHEELLDRFCEHCAFQTQTLPLINTDSRRRRSTLSSYRLA